MTNPAGHPENFGITGHVTDPIARAMGTQALLGQYTAYLTNEAYDAITSDAPTTVIGSRLLTSADLLGAAGHMTQTAELLDQFGHLGLVENATTAPLFARWRTSRIHFVLLADPADSVGVLDAIIAEQLASPHNTDKLADSLYAVAAKAGRADYFSRWLHSRVAALQTAEAEPGQREPFPKFAHTRELGEIVVSQFEAMGYGESRDMVAFARSITSEIVAADRPALVCRALGNAVAHMLYRHYPADVKTELENLYVGALRHAVESPIDRNGLPVTVAPLHKTAIMALIRWTHETSYPKEQGVAQLEAWRENGITSIADAPKIAAWIQEAQNIHTPKKRRRR